MKPQTPGVRPYLLTMLVVLLTLTSTARRDGIKALSCTANPVVTTNADSGGGSLRDAIADACDGSTITFANTVVSPITLLSELTIDKNLTIQGPGAGALTVSGNNAVRGFNIGSVNPSINVTLSGLTIAQGRATLITVLPSGTGFFGGGICVNIFGTLTVANSSLLNNNAIDMNNPGLSGLGGGIFTENGSLVVTGSTFSGNSGFGGGIFSNFSLNVTNCTFTGNQCSNTSPGGGSFAAAIYNNSVIGPNNVANSTFLGNTANNGSAFEAAVAGAIYNATTLNITNSTFAGNTASTIGTGAFGGAIYTGLNGPLNVTNSTFVGNTASSSGTIGSSGGAIFEAGPNPTNVKNTIIALNTVTGTNSQGPDVSGAFTSQGHNLIGKVDGSTGFTNGVNGDQVGSIASPLDPKLGPLQDNGGPTFTEALLPGSPAIDAGDDSVLGPPLSLTTDQRGAGFPRKFNAHVDIGAFEIQQVVVGPSFDTCLKDNATGNLFQWNRTTGAYKFTRCSDGFMLTGTGVVKLVNGVQTLTDFKSDRRISALFNTGQLTGNATLYLMVSGGVWQSFQIVDTNPQAVCACPG